MSKAPLRIAVAIAWLAALLNFFPLAWMLLASFKTEVQAIASPPLFFFLPTLDNYRSIFVDSIQSRRSRVFAPG